MDFVDSPEALQAKAEVENGEVGVIGTVDDLDEWIDNLQATEKAAGKNRTAYHKHQSML